MKLNDDQKIDMFIHHSKRFTDVLAEAVTSAASEDGSPLRKEILTLDTEEEISGFAAILISESWVINGKPDSQQRPVLN